MRETLLARSLGSIQRRIGDAVAVNERPAGFKPSAWVGYGEKKERMRKRARPTASRTHARSMLIDQRARCGRTCIFLAGGFRSSDETTTPARLPAASSCGTRTRAHRERTPIHQTSRQICWFLRPCYLLGVRRQCHLSCSCNLVLILMEQYRSRSVSKRADYSLEQKNT